MSELLSFNFALGIHNYTHPISFIIVCLIITGVLVYLNKKSEAVIFFLSFGITASSVVILKYFVAAPRPADALIDAGGYAFPSNHSSLSMFLAITVTWLLFYHSKLPKIVVGMISTLLFLSSVIIGLSRLTLHVHTPIQVIAGFILGMIIPIIAIISMRRLLNKHPILPFD